MAVYTVLNMEEVVEISNKYALTFYSFQGIREGILNTNYLLETNKGKFVLRILEGHRSFESEKKELDFLLELDGIIPCTVPYMTPEGETLVTYKNRLVSLFYYIEGKKLESITPDYLQQIGTLLALFHNFSQGKKLDRKTRIDEQYYFNKLNIAEIPISLKEKNSITLLCSRLKNIDFSALPTGIIHSDIFPDNIFVKDGKINGILDFNDSVTAPLIFDIGVIINYWIRINNFSPEKEREYISIFLNAYEKVRKLTPEEKKLLDMATLKMALAFILLRIDRLIVRKETGILIEEKSYAELLPLLRYYNI